MFYSPLETSSMQVNHRPLIDLLRVFALGPEKLGEWLWRLANASDLDLLLLLRSFLCSMVAQWSDSWLKLNIHAKLCYSFNGELLHNAVCCIQCNLETQWNNKPSEFQLELFSTLLATKISTTITNFLRSACATTLITVHNLICK